MISPSPFGGCFLPANDRCTCHHDLVDDTETEYDDTTSDLFSVAATPQTHSVLSILTSRCSGSDSSEIQDADLAGETLKKTFLKLHRPDVSHRCIIDPDEVVRILSLQADELLRRQSQHQQVSRPDTLQDGFSNKKLEMISSRQINNKLLDKFETQSRFGVLSDAGAASLVSCTTGVTTASRSTILAGNIARNDNNLYGNKKQQVADSLRKRLVLESVAEDDPAASSIKRQTETVETVADVSHPTRRAGLQSLIDYLGETTTKKMNSCVNLDKEDKRTQYMSVLRLQMKANLGRFYRQRYHAMFPNSPTLSGSQSNAKLGPVTDASIPELTSLEFSDISSSSDNGDSFNPTYKTTSSQSVHYGNLTPSKPIKCSVTGENFLDLAVTGSLGLLSQSNHGLRSESQSNPTSRSSILPRDRHQKSPENYICLINRRSGFPLAVCALKAAPGPPVVRIYATRRRVFTQRPSVTTQQLGLGWSGHDDDVPLYAWAELACDGDFPDPTTVSLYMANGSEGRFARCPSYQATFDPAILSENQTDGIKSSESEFMIRMTGRTDLERQMSGCALFSLRADDDGGGSFEIDLSKGIDPALLICFTAIIDEIVEKAMRDQCKMHARRKLRNAKKRLIDSQCH